MPRRSRARMSEETWHGGAPTLHRTRTTSPMHRCARDAKPFKDPAGAVSGRPHRTRQGGSQDVPSARKFGASRATRPSPQLARISDRLTVVHSHQAPFRLDCCRGSGLRRSLAACVIAPRNLASTSLRCVGRRRNRRARGPLRLGGLEMASAWVARRQVNTGIRYRVMFRGGGRESPRYAGAFRLCGKRRSGTGWSASSPRRVRRPPG
jgi:hypothetical protein